MNAEKGKLTGKCPVNFDHYSAKHASDWPAEYDAMRSACPVAWSEEHGGFWIPTRYKDIVSIAQDGDAFRVGKTFNPETGEAKGGINLPSQPIMRVLPLEADNPEWQGLRSLLNRRFGPGFVKQLRPKIIQFAKASLDNVIENGRMELIHDFSGPVPALTTMEILGIPLSYYRAIATPFHEMVYWPRSDPQWEQKVRDFERTFEISREYIALRRANPEDDLISYLISSEIDGVPLSDDTVMEIVYNVVGGGIDSTTNLTANVMKYLSDNPEQIKYLQENPDKFPLAIEEFVRYFSPVHALARTAAKDVTIGDVTIEAEDRVLLPFAAANRDPEVFERPDDMLLDRYPNRHIGFGAGMHRCMGSFLARAMFEAIMDEVLTRIPDFKVIEEKSRAYPAIGSINGWIDMEIVFTPGKKVGATY